NDSSITATPRHHGLTIISGFHGRTRPRPRPLRTCQSIGLVLVGRSLPPARRRQTDLQVLFVPLAAYQLFVSQLGGRVVPVVIVLRLDRIAEHPLDRAERLPQELQHLVPRPAASYAPLLHLVTTLVP